MKKILKSKKQYMQNEYLNECKKRDLKLTLVIILIAFAAACGGGSAIKSPTGRLQTYTTIDIVVNVGTNEYARLTAEKTVYDTVMSVITDSTGGKVVQEKKKVRDSSYKVWYAFPIPDSTGKNIRNKANTADSVMYRFTPIDSKMVLQDFNKNWPYKP
jgi:hypothetical protein